jgi:hypothetical protein
MSGPATTILKLYAATTHVCTPTIAATAAVTLTLDVPMKQRATTTRKQVAKMVHVAMLNAQVVQTALHATSCQMRPSAMILVCMMMYAEIVEEQPMQVVPTKPLATTIHKQGATTVLVNLKAVQVAQMPKHVISMPEQQSATNHAPTPRYSLIATATASTMQTTMGFVMNSKSLVA